MVEKREIPAPAIPDTSALEEVTSIKSNLLAAIREYTPKISTSRSNIDIREIVARFEIQD